MPFLSQNSDAFDWLPNASTFAEKEKIAVQKKVSSFLKLQRVHESLKKPWTSIWCQDNWINSTKSFSFVVRGTWISFLVWMNKRCKLGLERIIGILLSEWLFQKELLGNFLPIVINRIDVGWPEEIRRERGSKKSQAFAIQYCLTRYMEQIIFSYWLWKNRY